MSHSNQSFEDSSSPKPSTVNDHSLPNDSIVIRYEIVDPTTYMDNPTHAFNDPFYTSTVDEKIGSIIIEVLAKYQALMNANVNITIQQVKDQLRDGKMKHSDIYDLFDKFYMDMPAPVHIDSDFLNPESMSVLSEKHRLHAELKQQVKHVSTMISTLRDVLKTSKTDDCCRNVDCKSKLGTKCDNLVGTKCEDLVAVLGKMVSNDKFDDDDQSVSRRSDEEVDELEALVQPKKKAGKKLRRKPKLKAGKN